MKTNRKDLLNQREILEKRLRSWVSLVHEKAPPSGWIKAIRGALGMTSHQLASLLKITQATVAMLEKREADGKVTLEVIQKAAKAMNCKFVYAIIPDEHYESLNSIVEARAASLAKEIIDKVEHSMKLEKQGSDPSETRKQTERLAAELKRTMDRRLWDKS